MARNIGATLSLKDGNFFANMKSAVSAANNLKISLNGTQKSVSSFGEKLSGISAAAGKAAKGIVVAAGTSAAAVTAMVSGSVGSFADYEQLVGGVDTLFKESSAKLQNYASDAYKTAGMSANGYMETVTSFSASLISSLGGDTAKAVEYANTAIVDMSDNANKMGTDITSIQYAYQGFAKQNYTMLDNLKLGYGGTKEEMQRLLSDAEKIHAEAGKPIKYDISSFSDIVSAIHDVQTEMNITGTTAKEAASTISGSFSSMKAAWSNTLTALTVGGDMLDTSIDNLVVSVKTYIGNIVPAVGKALGGAGQLVSGLAPVIIAELPGLVSTVLPPLVQAAGTLVTGVVSQIPAIVSAVISAVPLMIKNTIGSIDMSAAERLISAFDKIKNSIANAFGGETSDIISSIASKTVPILITSFEKLADTISFVANHWNLIGPVLKGVLSGFLAYKGISGIFGNIGGAAMTFISNVGGVSKAFGTFKTSLMGLQIAKNAGGITTLLKGVKGLSTAGAGLGKAVSGLGGVFKGVGTAITFITSPVGAAVVIIGTLVAAGVAVYKNWDWLKEKAAVVGGAIKGLFGTVKSVVSGAFNVVKETIGTTMETARGVVHEKLANIKTAYEEHGGGIKGVVFAAMEGIKGYYTAGYDFIDKLTGGKLTTVKDKFLSIWEQAKTGIANIWTGIVNTVKGSINKVITGMNSMMSGAVGGINKLIGGINNISSKVGIPAIPTITAPKISLLASGGILTRATLFGMSGGRALIGGEAGAEAVLPLDMLWNKLREILSDKETQSGKGQPNITQYINIDAKTMTIEEIADRLAGLIKQKLLNV